MRFSIRDAVGREHPHPVRALELPSINLSGLRSSPRIVRYGVVTVTDSR